MKADWRRVVAELGEESEGEGEGVERDQRICLRK